MDTNNNLNSTDSTNNTSNNNTSNNNTSNNNTSNNNTSNNNTSNNNTSNNNGQINTCCLVGGLLGIISWFVGFDGLSGVVATIASIVGLNQLKASDGNGTGWGVTGFLLGTLNIIFYAVVLAPYSFIGLFK